MPAPLTTYEILSKLRSAMEMHKVYHSPSTQASLNYYCKVADRHLKGDRWTQNEPEPVFKSLMQQYRDGELWYTKA